MSARHTRSRTPAGRKKRVVKIVLIAVAVLIGWFGIRSAIVAFNLYSAQSLVTELQSEAASGDFDAVADTVGTLKLHTISAAAGTADPTWRLAELVPGLGANLHAVRMLSETANDIMVNLAAPAADVVAAIDLSERLPETGGFNLEPLAEVRVIAGKAAPVMADSVSRLSTIEAPNLVEPLQKIVIQIDEVVDKVAPLASSAEPVINVVSAALGQEGPRNYLLAFQNNAESTALGGSAAAYTLLHTDAGVVSIADQAGSGDFQEFVPVDVPVDQSAFDLYGSYLTDHINTSTSRPDFPTAASIMKAFWERDRGTSVDGVLSLDPIALALMLDATGDITLSSGDVLTSENAVSLLTNGIYFRYPNNEDQPKADAFFAEAAATIVGKVMSGDFDIPKMIKAVSTGVEQGDVLMWSSDTAEQSALDGMTIQGVLPASNEEETVIGVYYRDTSASKIDYYLETATTTTSDVCASPTNPVFSTAITLTSTLSKEAARTLPEYVASRDWGGTKFRTEVFVYGPIGATVASSTVRVEGLDTGVTSSTSDLGRPVAAFYAYLAPGQSTTVDISFVGAPGNYGPLEVRGTPMINPTVKSIDPVASCN